jgi:hypothetical protein
LVKPAHQQKSARAQHPADVRFGSAKSVFQRQIAALPPAPVIQTKLKIGESNDKFEQVADRVAELTENGNGSILPSAVVPNRSPVGDLQRLYGNQAVLQMRNGSGGLPASSVPLRPSQSEILQRKCACSGSPGLDGECAECRDKRLSMQRRTTGSPYPSQAPSIVHEVLRSPGQPLDPTTRAFFEPRFGHDFSHVRIHMDTEAAESARAVKAWAYTVGTDVVFGEGRYSPGTPAGQRLLAHELAHTLQQTKGAAAGAERISDPGDPAEQDADRAASDTMAGRKADVKTAVNGGTLHRWPWPLPAPEPTPPAPKPAPPAQVCDKDPLVESWGQDTCCSRWGFTDNEAVNKKTGEKMSSCNKWPLFLALHVKEHALEGVASCKSTKLGQKAQIKKDGNTLTVGCIDTRATKENVIEIDAEAAQDFFGSKNLSEHADEVCYGGSFDTDICKFETTCRERPKETWCLPVGVTKEETDSPAKHGWHKR